MNNMRKTLLHLWGYYRHDQTSQLLCICLWNHCNCYHGPRLFQLQKPNVALQCCHAHIHYPTSTYAVVQWQSNVIFLWQWHQWLQLRSGPRGHQGTLPSAKQSDGPLATCTGYLKVSGHALAEGFCQNHQAGHSCHQRWFECQLALSSWDSQPLRCLFEDPGSPDNTPTTHPPGNGEQ